MEYSFRDPDRLIGDIKSGEEMAYGFLFNALYDELTHFIYGLCKDMPTTEDIVQVAFIKVWEKREHIKIQTSLKNYMFSACYNQFIDHYRRNKNFDSVAIDLYTEVFIAGDAEQDQREANQKKVLDAIDRLPEKNRQVVILHKLKGHKYSEIAEMLKISIKTVENHLWKAYQRLREELDH